MKMKMKMKKSMKKIKNLCERIRIIRRNRINKYWKWRVKKEINKLTENELLLNQELGNYEREAEESEQEVNFLKDNNNKLLSELEKSKKK